MTGSALREQPVNVGTSRSGPLVGAGHATELKPWFGSDTRALLQTCNKCQDL